jgi:asparagine synthetase B (glutamine-hydrolysing)
LHGFTFVHYLLHVTGQLTPQPFVDGDVICLYNGEIYNQPYSRSDGEVIIPLYRKYGTQFAQHLDGEFAIAIYDFKQEIAIFCTDSFGTKPLWTKGLNVASYESCFGGCETPPNTIIVRPFDSDKRDYSEGIVDFDFDNQHKHSYEDWVTAFKKAVRKRAYCHCFIGLSSGYDSGAIACELSEQGCEFAAFGVRGSEDVDLLQKRLELVHGQLLTCSNVEYETWRAFLKAHAEEYDYGAVPGGPVHCRNMTDDWGAVGSAVLYNHAAGHGYKVCLCGQGADEILSDYSLYPDVSTLHGKFPKRLQPWPNFFNGCQRAYLRKEEHVAGCFGVEARYPYLDSTLVQEFLWLHPDSKNRSYKAPLDYYLRSHRYPYNQNRKTGFSAI